MRFPFLTALAALASVAVAELNSTVVVQSINTLTVKSQNLIEPAKQLSLVNAPLLIVGQGPWPKVILGITDIVATATASISVVSAAADVKFEAPEAVAIAAAFSAFVKVQKQLLETLVATTAGILSLVPLVVAPVAAALRSLESVIGSFALAIIGTVEASVAATMNTDLASLNVAIDAALKVYAAA